MLFMKVFIAVLILIFSLQSWTKADEISDFEIEGMSIGDSLLKNVDREYILGEIKINAKNYEHFKPKNKYGEVYIFESKNYDQFSFFVKPNDPKFKIHMFRGMINYNNNINKCKEKKSEIIKEIEDLFFGATKDEYKVVSSLDPTGRSYTLRTRFNLKNNGSIIVQCSDWEENFKKKNNFGEGISLVVQNGEIFEWFTSGN